MSTDVWTCYAAIIMAVSVIPFIIVQFPQVLHSKSGRHLAVLIALIVSVSLMISYCLYQVIFIWMTEFCLNNKYIFTFKFLVDLLHDLFNYLVVGI